MRFSYKPLVDKFKIPRPTLIEWHKRAKNEPNNWRVGHLEFLQNQIIVEKEALIELANIGMNYNEIFIFSICLYLEDKDSFIYKTEFKSLLKEFAFTQHNSLEYRHDFAREIWNIKLEDGSDRYKADYMRVYNLIDRLTSYQYYTLFMQIVDFIEKIRKKVDLGYSEGFKGKTWQELYSLQKEFSKKSIKTQFLHFIQL